MKQLLLYTIAWGLLLMAATFFANKVLERAEPLYNTNTIQRYQAINNTKPSVIVLGTSRVMCSVNDKIVDAHFPATNNINLGITNLSLNKAAFVIKDIIKKPGKKILIIEMNEIKNDLPNSFLIATSILGIPKVYTNYLKSAHIPISSIGKIVRQLNVLKVQWLNTIRQFQSMLKYTIGKKPRKIGNYYFGYRKANFAAAKSDSSFIFNDELQLANQQPVNQSINTLVHEIINMEDSQLRVVFIMPFTSCEKSELNNIVPVFNQIDAKHKWEYPDSLSTLCQKKYLMNLNHLNSKGAAIYTEWFSRRLQIMLQEEPTLVPAK